MTRAGKPSIGIGGPDDHPTTAAGDVPRGDADVAFERCSYEELIDTMEALTARMAGGDIGIEEVADLYERVGRLHAEATSRLARVRQRIEGLMAASGVPTATDDIGSG